MEQNTGQGPAPPILDQGFALLLLLQRADLGLMDAWHQVLTKRLTKNNLGIESAEVQHIQPLHQSSGIMDEEVMSLNKGGSTCHRHCQNRPCTRYIRRLVTLGV
jgi:hypothetical protein